jgi:hypothetical protein
MSERHAIDMRPIVAQDDGEAKLSRHASTSWGHAALDARSMHDLDLHAWHDPSMSRSRSAVPLVLLLLLPGCPDDEPEAPDQTGNTTSGDGSSGTTGVDTTTGPVDPDGSSGSSSSDGSETGSPPMGYDDPALWLCHPDKTEADDQCRGNDLRATEILPDGSTQVVEHVIAEDPAYDCFYVYPTVDIRLTPGQTESFDDVSQELDPLLSQAARFTAQCRVFAPLYHQVTIGTFGSPMAAELLDAAYQDVAAAFESYRQLHLGERPFVLMGHSQGTFMTTRLLQEVIEPDEALRSRLVVALMIGGSVSVPDGEDRGGTFAMLPLCTSAEQPGCVLAYRSYAIELPPEPGGQSADAPDRKVACTDPMALLGHERSAGAYLPSFSNQPLVFPPIDFGMPIDTPFVLYRDLYASACLVDGDGHGYLAISAEPAAGDVRTNPVDFAQPLLDPGFLGLHVLDYNFPLDELMELVAVKAQAMGA